MAKKSYTVGQVNGYIKNLISSDYLLGDIYVKEKSLTANITVPDISIFH